MGQLRLLGEPPASDDHAALANLTFPQAGHTGFVAAAGLGGGQAIIGGTAAGENLSLQSTAHAARGYVRAQDDLQLLSNIIRDSAANQRITLAAASPHVTLAGNIRAGDRVGIGSAPDANMGLKVDPSISAGSAEISLINASAQNIYITSGTGAFYGILANPIARVNSGATGAVDGLLFTGQASGQGVVTQLVGCRVRAGLFFYSNANKPNLYGFYAMAPNFTASTYAANVTGVHIANQGGYAANYNAIGLRIEDITAVTGNRYLIEAGPATPYLRLVGGAAPGAGLSNLYLNIGGTLLLVSAGAADSGGAGYRLLRVPN